MADFKRYNFKENPVSEQLGRLPKKPTLILTGFGLQAVRASLYNFGSDEPDKVSPVGTSYLGTPVFSNIDFLEGSYKNLKGEQIDYLQGEEGDEDTKGFSIDTVLMSVNQSKRIIKTPIQGRNGTVKEYISDGDFDITIKGAIVDPSPEKYPEDAVLKLMDVCKVQKEVAISSRFLNDVFDITNLVIVDYKLPQTEGFQNVQFFELRCISDDPVELTIRQ